MHTRMRNKKYASQIKKGPGIGLLYHNLYNDKNEGILLYNELTFSMSFFFFEKSQESLLNNSRYLYNEMDTAPVSEPNDASRCEGLLYAITSIA